MSSQSYSSFGTGIKRRGVLHDDIDRSVYTVGQTLASIVNDPRTAHQTGGGFWGLGHDASQAPQPPPLDLAKYPPVSKADLQQYINLVHGAYDRFIRDRQSLEAFDAKHQPGSSDPRAGCSQGEPFMAAVQVVPMPFFQEGFFDNWDEFFRQYCKEQSADELYEQIDQLNKNLDVVELQLLREVASRSDSFFQAAASLQHLLGMLGESVGSIRSLRRSLAESDEQMYSTAVAVKGLQARRSNLQATLDITKGLEEVMAAQAALDCMLEGQDYAGALELLSQLKALLEQPGLMGLQCVRHLPPRLVDTTAAVERALAAEFLQTLVNGDVARVVAEAAADAEAQPDASVSTDGRAAAAFAWQLPPNTIMRDAAAAREQLHEKLLPLAVGLYRAERLPAALQQYKANVGEEVKAAVRDAVQQVLPVLLAACGEQQHAGHAGSETQLADQLQLLHHGAFVALLHAAARVIFSCVDRAVVVAQLLEATLASVNTPASQLAALRKECSAALQVVVDVGLGRWVKLLAARSAANTRLKQYELRQLLDLSEQVASYTETLGARTLGSFRSALQAQCKGLLDASHARAMNQLQHLLESEQWVAVEVPGSFQAIVDRLVARCGEGAALLDGRQHPAPAAHGSTVTAADAAADAGDGGSGSTEAHSATLQLCGKSFHLVNSGLMLLKMLDEYMSLYELMPQFGAEIVHRELELLKLFNSQTAALVLGAGAMRTAGLRSISAKQLALSCQAVAMLATLLPLLRAGSLGLVSQPRRALLMPEFDRLLQDLTMHMDEVHSKLVDIMRDRLSAAVQTLPGEVRQLAANPALAPPERPSHTVALLVKQLGTLRAVLAPYLLKEEVEFIFGAVARAYSDALSETFEGLLAQDGSCEGVVKANALAMLLAFRDLPLDPSRSSNYCSRLSTTYTKHFGLPPWDQERLGHKVQQQDQQQQRQEQQQQQQQQLQEQELLQLQHVASQQLQEQESDQLTAHQQQPEPQQQQQQDLQHEAPLLPPPQQQEHELQQQQLVTQLGDHEQLQQPEQQGPLDDAAQASMLQTSQQVDAYQQLLSEPGAPVVAAAAAAAVAPLGAPEQLGQEQHLELEGHHLSAEEEQVPQQQLAASEQSPVAQQQEQQQEDQQQDVLEGQQQQQQVPGHVAQELLPQPQQRQQVDAADAAAGVDGQQMHALLAGAAAADTGLEQPVAEETTLLLRHSQDDTNEQQIEQQIEQQTQLQEQQQQELLLQHSVEPQQEQLDAIHLSSAAAADSLGGERVDQLGADDVLAEGSLRPSLCSPVFADGAVSSSSSGIETNNQQQLQQQQQQQQQQRQQVSEHHCKTLEQHHPVSGFQVHAVKDLRGPSQQPEQDSEDQQQQQQVMPSTSEGTANGKQLETEQTPVSAAIEGTTDAAAQHDAAAVAPGAGEVGGSSNNLSLRSQDAAAVSAAIPAVDGAEVHVGNGAAAVAANAAVSAALSDLLEGLEQLQAQPAATAEAAADAQETYGLTTQPPAAEPAAVPRPDTDVAGDTLQAAPAGDLLGDWGYDGMLQEPGSSAVAAPAAFNGDMFSNSISTAPLQQQQQQQQSGKADRGAAGVGGLQDLLWDDGAQQQQPAADQQQAQQQQHDHLGSSSLQESSSFKWGVQPPAVDSFEDLSQLDSPSAAAAAADAGEGLSAFVEQHCSSSNGDVGQLQTAEQPEVAFHQLVESGAAGPGPEEDSKISSSEAAARGSLPSSGSWDPLNASSAPPTAANVEGTLL